MYKREWEEESLLSGAIELKNICKFPYFVYKVKEINAALEKEEITRALRIARILMEGTCVYILEKHDIDTLKTLTYGIIADEFRKLGVEKISNLLLHAYGSLSYVVDNGGIQAEHVVYFVESFEELLCYVIRKYPDLLDGLEENLEKYF